MRPESFDADLAERWSRWVLDHGLPEVPGSELGVGESVPVAYWIGPSTAAVLHIRRVQDEDDECLLTETDIDLFCLVEGNWETWGGGGGGWPDKSPLARLAVAPTHVDLGGMNSGVVGDRGCKALWGSVGTEAVMAEVRQAGQVTRRPVESPVGAFVVSGEYTEPFTVRVLNAQGDVLAEVEEPAGFADESP
jgi:hypothetical protein